MKSQDVLDIILFAILIIIIFVFGSYALSTFAHFGTMDPEYKEAFSSLVNAIDNGQPYFYDEIYYDPQSYDIVFNGSLLEVYDCQFQTYNNTASLYFIYNYTFKYLDRSLKNCYLVYEGIINQNYNITIITDSGFEISMPNISLSISSNGENENLEAFLSSISNSSSSSYFNQLLFNGTSSNNYCSIIYYACTTYNSSSYLFSYSNILASSFEVPPKPALFISDLISCSENLLYNYLNNIQNNESINECITIAAEETTPAFSSEINEINEIESQYNYNFTQPMGIWYFLQYYFVPSYFYNPNVYPLFAQYCIDYINCTQTNNIQNNISQDPLLLLCYEYLGILYNYLLYEMYKNSCGILQKDINPFADSSNFLEDLNYDINNQSCWNIHVYYLCNGLQTFLPYSQTGYSYSLSTIYITIYQNNEQTYVLPSSSQQPIQIGNVVHLSDFFICQNQGSTANIPMSIIEGNSNVYYIINENSLLNINCVTSDEMIIEALKGDNGYNIIFYIPTRFSP